MSGAITVMRPEAGGMTRRGPSGEGAVAMVTGASSGIGEATARCLARAGFRVALVARRQHLLEEVGAKIRAAGGEARVIPADLADEGQTHRACQLALDSFGTVDLLVNNAGYGPPFALEQMDRTALRHAFDVNLLASAQLIAELTPVMRAHGGGRIINVSSLANKVAAPFATVYAATKAALESMTDCLRLELEPWNIALSLVIPGFVHTPTFQKAKEVSRAVREDLGNPYRDRMAKLEQFADTQLAKTGITAEEVGAVIVRAAKASVPKPRYYVPLTARLAAAVFGELPDRARDRVLLGMYGIASRSNGPRLGGLVSSPLRAPRKQSS
jgi:short-subunit dehydrogenase